MSALKADRIVVAPDHERLGAFGDPARNRVLDQGVGTKWAATIDDDDVYLPGAIDAMRDAIRDHGGPWFIFQMVGGANSHFPGKIVGSRRQLRLGEIGAPTLLFPSNVRARFKPPADTHPEWPSPGDGAFGDYGMALALREELGDPVWVPRVIAMVRP